MRARRLVVGAVGTVAATVGLIGMLHMPFARGLLMRLGGCPVGNASLAEMEPRRHEIVDKERGATPAPARPALGFTLDKTTHAELDAWAERSHVSCREERKALVFCKDVPAAALGLPDVDGPVSEVHFGFYTKGTLFDVSTIRNEATPRKAQEVESRLEAQVGPPQQKSGSFDDAHLALAGIRSLASVSYKYRDYFAEVIAMRFQEGGLVVREHFMSAND